LRLPLLVVVLLALVVGCATGEPAATARRSPQFATAPAAASVAVPDPADEPSLDPALDPDLSPEPSDSPSGAATCTGTDDNRTFLQMVADKVKWDVYCAVLPAGWRVDKGSYRLASGGRLEIAYKGPNGARIELHEGAFCSDTNGCVPDGVDRGAGTFGDRDAEVVATPDGAVSVVADRGRTISWVALATGVRETTVRQYLAALVRIEREAVAD